MDAAAILRELARRGVELQPAGDRLRFRPPDAVPPDLLAELREKKPAVLAVLVERRVLEALAGFRVASAAEIEAATGLPRRALLEALGRLYDAGEVRTDPSGAFWRPVERCAECVDLRARGVPRIFCSACRFHPRNDQDDSELI